MRCLSFLWEVGAEPHPSTVFFTDSAHFNQTAKLARSIVVVNVNPHLFTTTRIRYEKNVWARPQIVAYVNAASDSALLADMPRFGTQLANLLVRAEMNAAILQLGGGGNVKASGIVAEMFGFGIKIPSDMKSYKTGRNFVWLSGFWGVQLLTVLGCWLAYSRQLPLRQDHPYPLCSSRLY